MKKRAPSLFTVAAIAVIRKIPRGRVATYGQIATLAGKPHGARGVSWILHSCGESHHLPWHRVIGSGGKISLPEGSRGRSMQEKRLEAEGVEVSPEGRVDLARFQLKARSRSGPAGSRPPRKTQRR